jgi:uncharacterized protein (UPF0332 family)
MTPEVGDYLAKARHALAEARAVMGIGLADAAGPAAYLAAYHAAQAYIFTGTGQAAKTHSGVRSEFSRLAKDDPRIDRSFLTFLAQAYTLKEVADYEMGPGAVVPPERAAAAIETAARSLIASPDCSRPPTRPRRREPAERPPRRLFFSY